MSFILLLLNKQVLLSPGINMQMDGLKTCQTENYSTPGKVQQLESSVVAKVRVIVRVRPFLPRESNSIDGKTISCVSVLNSECQSSDDVTVHLKDHETR